MKNKIFESGENISYLVTLQSCFEDGFVLDYVDDTKIGRIADAKDKYHYFVTNDKEFLEKYQQADDMSKKYRILCNSIVGNYSTIPQNRVLIRNDKRIKKYNNFYSFLKNNKIRFYLDINKELEKYFDKYNSILCICAQYCLRWFLKVPILGLIQFVLGDIINYFTIQHKIFNKEFQLNKQFSENNNKNEMYEKLNKELENLIKEKYETNRAFLAFIISLIALVITIVIKQ
jgi:hypothetical protein